MAAPKSMKGNALGGLHTEFVRHVDSLKGSVISIMDHFGQLTVCFQRALEMEQGCARTLVDASVQLSKDLRTVSGTFLECLSDLATMGEAMKSVAETSPDTASALMVNLYSTCFRQMKAYFCDTGDKFTRCGDLLEKGKIAFYKDGFAASGRESSRRFSIATAPQDLKRSSITHEIPERSETAFHDDTPARAEGAGDYFFDPSMPLPFGDEEAKELEAAPTTAPFPRPTASDGGRSEVEFLSFPADGSPRARARGLLEEKDAAAPPRHGPEPAYVQVSTTVEDALGPLVLAHRPTQFSEVEAMLGQAPVAVYYLELPRPGSLAHFIVKNYFDVDEGVRAELLCGVLETDRVEVELLGSTAGEVVAGGGGDLSWVPSCAWRSSANEDHTRLFYTMYTLIEQAQSSTRMALVQDALVCAGGARVEMLHVVGLLDAVPRYAKVSVYTTSPKGTAGAGKAATIASLTRRSFRQLGFLEADERAVREAVRGAVGTYTGAPPDDASEDGDPSSIFLSTVQFASLDEPGEGAAGANYSIRDVVRGGMGMLRAPLTLGRAVGEAVLDATGVSDAVRTSVENLFRKSLPGLSDEKIIDFFNAAWVENGTPKQGYLYITEHWVCFMNPECDAHFAIELDEIKDIQKSKSSKVLNNTINITTHLGEEYFLTGFLKRDHTYSLLMNHWIKG